MSDKTISVSYRVTSRFKNLLDAAAAEANRSRTNMLEHLLYEYCKREGIEAEASEGIANTLQKVGSR